MGLAEAAAVAIGVVHPPRLALTMGVAFTLAHVAAKVPWYWIGARAEVIRWRWAQRAIARARGFLQERPAYGTGLLALSALTSMPPFHLASIAAGLTAIPFGRFLFLCLVGRLVRFGVLGAFPSLLGVVGG